MNHRVSGSNSRRKMTLKKRPKYAHFAIPYLNKYRRTRKANLTMHMNITNSTKCIQKTIVVYASKSVKNPKYKDCPFSQKHFLLYNDKLMFNYKKLSLKANNYFHISNNEKVSIMATCLKFALGITC